MLSIHLYRRTSCQICRCTRMARATDCSIMLLWDWMRREALKYASLFACLFAPTLIDSLPFPLLPCLSFSGFYSPTPTCVRPEFPLSLSSPSSMKYHFPCLSYVLSLSLFVCFSISSACSPYALSRFAVYQVLCTLHDGSYGTSSCALCETMDSY